nr:hypothetical protein [Streptococcus parasuis]
MATYYPMIIAFFSIILIGIVNMRTLHADLPQYDVDKLSTVERQGRPLNPLLWGLGVALLSSLFASLALSAIAYLQKLEADSAKKK